MMSDRWNKHLGFLAGHVIQDIGRTDFRDVPKMRYHEFRIGLQKVLTILENNITIDPGDFSFSVFSLITHKGIKNLLFGVFMILGIYIPSA